MKMIPSIIIASIIVVFGTPHLHGQVDPNDPNNWCTNACTYTNIISSRGSHTNVVGIPVIRIASLRQATNSSDVGTLVSTNLGFFISTSNTVESHNITIDGIYQQYKWLTLGVINTSTNRSYEIQVIEDEVVGLWSPIDFPFNGTGTNEYVWMAPSAYTTTRNLFFRVKDVGPSE
jgi:hypothetical protein